MRRWPFPGLFPVVAFLVPPAGSVWNFFNFLSHSNGPFTLLHVTPRHFPAKLVHELFGVEQFVVQDKVANLFQQLTLLIIRLLLHLVLVILVQQLLHLHSQLIISLKFLKCLVELVKRNVAVKPHLVQFDQCFESIFVGFQQLLLYSGFILK